MIIVENVAVCGWQNSCTGPPFLLVMASSSADDQHKRQQEGDDLDEVLVAAGAQGGSATSRDQGEDRREVEATRAQRTNALTVTSANHAAIGMLAQRLPSGTAS